MSTSKAEGRFEVMAEAVMDLWPRALTCAVCALPLLVFDSSTLALFTSSSEGTCELRRECLVDDYLPPETIDSSLF